MRGLFPKVMNTVSVWKSKVASQMFQGKTGSSAISSIVRAIRIRISAAMDPNRDVSFYATVNGGRVAVPGFTHTGIYRKGTTDSDLATVFAGLPSDAVVLDIGANVGEFSLLASQVATDGTVHSFEPCPLIRPYLEMTIHVNERKNVIVHASALSDFNGAIPLRFGTRTAMSSTSAAQNRSWEASVDVAAEIGDDVVDRELGSRLDFMKIDVEGAEAAVVQGLSASIGRLQPVIVVEMDGHGGERAEAELLELLRTYEYEIFDFSGAYGKGELTLEAISGNKRPESGKRNPNVLAAPKGRLRSGKVAAAQLFATVRSPSNGAMA
jgi:FkbM family methyltransferase